MSKSIMHEEWKYIEGFAGRYQVSNLGNVRSLPYISFQKSSHEGVMMSRMIHGKMISATDNGNGYKIVGLYKDKHRKQYYVHRLVAEAFIPNPLNLPEINHIDFDKSNNSAKNLQWVNRSENVNWSKENMRKPTHKARLTNLGMRYISLRNGRYRVNIHIKRLGYQLDKSFNTLEEAIKAKEEYINGKEYFAR